MKVLCSNIILQLIFLIFQNVAGVVGEILSTKGKYKKNWEAINSDNSFHGAQKPRKRLEDYLMTLLRKVSLEPDRQNPAPYKALR